MKKVKSGKSPTEATRKAPKRTAKRPAAKALATRGKAAKARKAPVAGGTKKRVAAPAKAASPVLQIRQLDPVRVCGDRTSVVQLFRVDEEGVTVGKAAGARQVHLVFNDRHGWYCEHGRSCHAVSAVMRHAGIR